MISLIAPRRYNADYEKMVKIWDWCILTFGKANAFYTWDAGFADSSDDWVKFVFYDESLATMFKLMYPHTMSQEEFETYKWQHQNDYA